MPQDANESWLDTMSGMKLPAAHCAFKGCAWVGVSSDSIDEHIRTVHGKEIERLCNLLSEDPHAQHMDYYCAAIVEVERRPVKSGNVHIGDCETERRFVTFCILQIEHV